LEPRAIVGELPDAVEDKIHNLFADSVMSTGEIVGRVFLAGG